MREIRISRINPKGRTPQTKTRPREFNTIPDLSTYRTPQKDYRLNDPFLHLNEESKDEKSFSLQGITESQNKFVS